MSLITIDSTLKFGDFNVTSKSGKLEFEKKILINSPTLEIVKAPQKSKYTSDYSFGVKFYESSKNKEKVQEQKEVFKSLVNKCRDNLLDEIMKNEKVTGKKYSSVDEIQVSKFFYDNDVFYINFNPRTVNKYKYNKKTKQQEILTDNIVGMLGVGSIINMYMSPSCYYGKKTERLTPFSLTADKIVIRKSKNNSGEYTNNQRHNELSNYGFGKIEGYTLSDDIVVNEDVPVHDCSDFDVDNYKLSRIVDIEGKKYIYGTYGPSMGRTYFRSNNVVVMYDIKESQEYKSRTIVTKNQDILSMVGSMDKVLLAKVKACEQDLFGREKDIDSIRENNYTNPLKDADDPRAVLKLASIKSQTGEKLIDVFIIGEDNVIRRLDLDNSYDTLEKYISSGTQLESVVFSIRPVIVNKNIYLTMNLQQILINPRLAKVSIPRSYGFMFKNSSYLKDVEYDIGNIPETEYSEYNDTFYFVDYDAKKGFESFVDDKKMFLLNETSSIYDVCLEDNPDEYKTFGKVKCHLSEENKKTFESITDKVIEYTVKNSKNILGQKKKESVIRDMFDESPPLIKYAKNDVDKKNPFFNLQVSCYKKEDSSYSLDFTAFKLMDNTIQKLDIDEPEDLLQVFTAGTRFVPFIKMKGMCVNKTVYLKMYVSGGLVLPAYEVGENKFDDDISDSEDEEVPVKEAVVKENAEQSDSDNYQSEEEESDDE
jgi:hypothetical protein